MSAYNGSQQASSHAYGMNSCLGIAYRFFFFFSHCPMSLSAVVESLDCCFLHSRLPRGIALHQNTPVTSSSRFGPRTYLTMFANFRRASVLPNGGLAWNYILYTGVDTVHTLESFHMFPTAHDDP